jgi:hypothetical protein
MMWSLAKSVERLGARLPAGDAAYDRMFNDGQGDDRGQLFVALRGGYR